MARQGLFDDSGYHGFDYEISEEWCEQCEHHSTYEEDGEIYFECLNGICERREKY